MRALALGPYAIYMEAGPEKHVVLIKAAKSPEDAYKKVRI